MYRGGSFDERLQAARAAVREHAHVARMYTELAADLAREEVRAQQLAAELVQERLDVQRASGTWAKLKGVFGDAAARLSKEEQEAALAEASLHEAQTSRDELRAQVARLANRRDELAGSADELAQARAAKQATLVDTPTGNELAAIADQLGEIHGELREIVEAIAAGDLLLDSLSTMMGNIMAAQELANSRSMGIDMIAMAKMGAVRELAGTAHAQLRVFQRELADLQIELVAPVTLVIDVRIGPLLVISASSFTPTFAIVGDLMNQVGQHLGALRKRQIQRATGLAALEVERDRLLVT